MIISIGGSLPDFYKLWKWLAIVSEKAMATHSSTLAWKIPWVEEPGRLQSMGSLGFGHDWVTSLSLFTFMHWRRNGNPLQCYCLENPKDWGDWWADVYGLAQIQTWLKWRSSSSNNCFGDFALRWNLIFKDLALTTRGKQYMISHSLGKSVPLGNVSFLYALWFS